MDGKKVLCKVENDKKIPSVIFLGGGADLWHKKKDVPHRGTKLPNQRKMQKF